MKDIDFRSLTRPKDLEEFMVNFIDTLPSKGSDAYSRFEQCIKDSHDHLGHCYITASFARAMAVLRSAAMVLIAGSLRGRLSDPRRAGSGRLSAE